MVKFIADGVLMEIVDVINGDLPQSFTLDITGVRELKIEHVGQNGGTVTATNTVMVFPTTSTGSIKLGGIVYKNSFSMSVGAASHSASFNLNGKYTTLSGLIGTLDNVAKDAMVNIFAGGNVIMTFEISGGALPQSFSLDVRNVKNLKIEHVGKNGGAVGLAELSIK